MLPALFEKGLAGNSIERVLEINLDKSSVRATGMALTPLASYM